MKRSSNTPPPSRQSTLYCAPPTGIAATSLESSRCSSSSASGPTVSISPMCDTSKIPQPSRTARCSARTPAYCTGISQPANSTSFGAGGDVAVVQCGAARGTRHGPQAIGRAVCCSGAHAPPARCRMRHLVPTAHAPSGRVACDPADLAACGEVIPSAFKHAARGFTSRTAARRCRRRRSPATSARGRRCGDRGPPRGRGARGARRGPNGGRSRCRSP